MEEKGHSQIDQIPSLRALVENVARKVLGSVIGSDSVFPRLTLKGMGADFCASRADILNALRYLENKHLIRLEPRRIVITNLHGLESLGKKNSRGEYCL